jgi:signal transduction histidine kinase
MLFIFTKIYQYSLQKNLIVSFIFYFLSILSYYYFGLTYSTILIIISLFFLHLYFLKDDNKYKLFSFIWFFTLIFIYYFEPKDKYVEIIVPLTVITLLIREYKDKLDFFISIIISSILIVSYYHNFQEFTVLLSLYPFYFLFNFIKDYEEKIRREGTEYKKMVDRAINAEVQKKLLEAEENIVVSSKKLKEIFKLSNYTASTTDIQSMAERVVDGLLDLGYTGVLISIFPRNIFKKGGFFPNYKLIVENISDKNLNKIQINEEDKYIIIPLIVSNEKLGYIAVYKKEGVSFKEIEYLTTYANSVATAVANIIHFEDLIKLEELTYKTFESLDIAIAALDENFNVKISNKRFEEIQTYENGNLFERIPELLFLKKDLESVIKNKKPFETIISSIKKQQFTYRIKALPLQVENIEEQDFPKIVLIIEDITEKEKLESQIIETEKLAVIGKMAAALAHEIKNPLTAIAASAYRIKNKAKKLNDEKIVEFSEKIELHSERARNIIDRVLNYSKPSYHKLEKINIKDLIKETIEFIEHSLKGKNLKIKTNLRKNIYVKGDKNSLQQVFINILMNAVEAVENTEEPLIEINLDKDEKYAVIFIKDNGEGIPEEIKDKIFEPFFSTKEKGTGLGLSVVERIIKDHSGEIEVNVKDGTTFIVKLPFMEE